MSESPAQALPWYASGYLLPVAVGVTVLFFSTLASSLCWFFREVLNQIKQLTAQHLGYLEKENERNREQRIKDTEQWLGVLKEFRAELHEQADASKDMHRMLETVAAGQQDLAAAVRELREEIRSQSLSRR